MAHMLLSLRPYGDEQTLLLHRRDIVESNSIGMQTFVRRASSADAASERQWRSVCI